MQKSSCRTVQPPQGKTARLDAWLIHESNESLSYWIRKQNEFSDWNAARRLTQLLEPVPPLTSLLSDDPLQKRRFLKALYLRLPCKPFLMFLYLYVLRLGILDGTAGYYFCRLRAIHEFNIQAKITESRLARLHGHHNRAP